MTMRTDRLARIKARACGDAQEAQAVVRHQLEELARDGARRMLTEALEDEVEAYLGRPRYGRTEGFRGYRNGVLSRRLMLGAGTIDLNVPRTGYSCGSGADRRGQGITRPRGCR